MFEDILILPDDFSFEFDARSGTWSYCGECEDEQTQALSLDEYLENEIAFANELAGQRICRYAVVLMDGSCIEDPEPVKREKRFLVYDENRPEVLKQLCENPMEWRKYQ